SLCLGRIEEGFTPSMNDFTELENDLKKLRPVSPSAGFFSRVEQGIEAAAGNDALPNNVIRPDRFRIYWGSIGVALAAAAVFVILARIDLKHLSSPQQASTTPAPSAPIALPASEFVPTGATQVVYRS